ncbi:MAG TPA: hypothetical protein VEQ60_18775 [Longimicrobium sp.]|nr:hypothetical protein [Longimicrobium sp.]
MLERETLIAHIRFQLEQLGPKNRHHEFERIALHLARARIAPNLLPATGPVSSGGDAGRDAETFTTYCRERRGGLAAPAEDTIVLICTTQASALAAKIKSDVSKAVRGHPRPDRIYVFLTADLPVSVRHRMVEWARSDHGIAMEILDGQAISCFLADWDLAWIAHDFLHIPTTLLSSSLPDLAVCRIAANAAFPTHPDVQKRITFTTDDKIEVEVSARPGAEPLRFGIAFRDAAVAERVERATRYGDAIRLTSDEQMREYEIEPDPRIAAFFNELSRDGQHLVINPPPAIEVPVRLVAQDDSLAIPYATLRTHGTHRVVLESPHLSLRLTIDTDSDGSLRIQADFSRTSATVFWRTLMFLKNAQEESAPELVWLTDDSRRCSLDFITQLADELAAKGFFSEKLLCTLFTSV